MNITIKAKNAVELEDFIPVTGTWSITDKQDEDSIYDVEASIVNWMDSSYSIDVKVFHVDGREISGDLPWEGTFLVNRK
jgi:hypothetical protein